MGTRSGTAAVLAVLATACLALPAAAQAAPVSDAHKKPLDEGDRVTVWGQWIWDCGHGGEGSDFSAPSQTDPTAPLTHTGDYLLPGETESELIGIPDNQNIRGEQTELHPLEALVVRRAVPHQALARESETDAYISTKGTGAHAEERCSHDLAPPAGQPFRGPDFTACV